MSAAAVRRRGNLAAARGNDPHLRREPRAQDGYPPAVPAADVRRVGSGGSQDPGPLVVISRSPAWRILSSRAQRGTFTVASKVPRYARDDIRRLTPDHRREVAGHVVGGVGGQRERMTGGTRF